LRTGRPKKLKSIDVEQLAGFFQHRDAIDTEIEQLRRRTRSLVAERKRMAIANIAAEFDVDRRTISRYRERL